MSEDDEDDYPNSEEYLELVDKLESAENVLHEIMWEEVEPVAAATAWLQQHASGMVGSEEWMAEAKRLARAGAVRSGKPYAECLKWLR